jgi:AraC family transcriptional regulator of adaptative response/methylated-DNA-[protein]-cysteine methyltransferase
MFQQELICFKRNNPMNKITFLEKYKIISTKDTPHEDIFYTAVKTTGIFCHPSCGARTPKSENVIFYDSTQEAIQNGFRPCKVCKPMEKMGIAPDYITSLIKELHQNPYLNIKDDDLKERGVKPSKVESWFKKHHNITFHTYQRMLRINFAFNSLKKSEAATNAAFVKSCESLSGFNESYRFVFGNPPTNANKKTVLNIVRFSTPVGPMFACASSKGICLLDFTDCRTLETDFQSLSKRLNAVIVSGKNSHLDHVQSELQEYFTGNRKNFTVPLYTLGTDFQKSVWKILQDIPFGQTRSYKQQAIALGNPKAIRAVASANGSNPISIIIPCHRVIGSDGSLIDYGGGLHRKKWLLDYEKINVK